MRAFRSPRCYFVHAQAPAGVELRDANAAFNAFCAGPGRGQVLFHDHHCEPPGGGVAVFFVRSPDELETLRATPELDGWTCWVHALIHSRSPAGFDEQIAYTVANYGDADWARLRAAGAAGA